MSDLQELFARLKASSSTDAPAHSQTNAQPSIWAQPQYQPPSVSSPLFSPPIQTPNPMHDSRILSPVGGMAGTSSRGTPAPDSQSTNNLLNLLKFNNNRTSQGGEAASPLASLQNVGAGARGSLNAVAGSDNPSTSRPATQQQDLLLNLLKKPNASKAPPAVVQSIEKDSAPTPPGPADIDKLAQSFADASFQPAASPSQSARSSVQRSSPARQFGTSASRETTPFEAPQPQRPANAGMFNYVNPFDQLHTSSPLNRTPRPEAQQEKKQIEILKHDRDVSSGMNGGGGGGEGSAPATKSRKKDGQTEVERQPGKKNSSVSEALEGVGEKVDRQVERKLASASSKPEASTGTPVATADGTAESANRESEIKKETHDGDNEEVESSWESAEDSANERAQAAAEAAAQEEYKVKVYNFPMKPFVTITITPDNAEAMSVRQDDFMVIAKLKKEFDQMDRCLATASKDHMVYAQTATKRDNAGFRIIRQDTGDHKRVFELSGERVFSVQVCSPPGKDGGDVESVLGTGVNGSVFWTSLAKTRSDLFDDDDVEAQGFIMPAPASAEDQTTSTVKTRGKLSCRHTDVFALSRSKIIHIISPDTAKDRAYCNTSTRKVDTQKYVDEHGLRINTGKAGKDFCWSEDDTVIASLDKSGVVKFWDVKPLVARATDISGASHAPVELSTPVWSITATASVGKPDERAPSVSSVMLLDKERPHTKGVALRYMLVGFKQNHILQLWDLGLGKAVQELRLPHEQDSDGFCSVTYHPKTGIIAVGHPTRNSIYFIHLSAPKYNIPVMDQARYLSLLATGDRSLPRPESTAIMSGLREFSLNRVGSLRSLDMLRVIDPENVGEKGTAEETLFELYIMHSKGVVGIPVKRADLGWDAQSKMVDPIDAVNAGVVTVVDLRFPAPGAKTEVAASEASSQVETPSRKSKKQEEKVKTAPAAAGAPAKPAVPPASARNGVIRPEPPSMQIPEAPTPSEPSVNPPLMTADSYAMAAQSAKPTTQTPATRQHAGQVMSDGAKETVESSKGDAAPASTPAPAVSPPSTSSAGETAPNDATLSRQFDGLYQRLDADKRVSEAAGAARQDAMLRLVSSTLTENVEQSLHRIIGASIQNEVIPALTGVTKNIVEKKMAEVVPGAVNASIAKEMKAALPAALQGALKDALRDQQVHKTISDLTASHVSQTVQKSVSSMLQQSLPTMATQATQKMVSDLETRMGQRLREAQMKTQEANQQVEQLSGLVRSLTETVNRMAEGQTAFQEQILKMQRERSSKGVAGTGESSSAAGSAASGAGGSQPDPQKAAEEAEVNRITQMLMHGDFEEATIQWLQSANQAHLFDNLFVRVNPHYLQQVTPLVALSVSAAITASLGTNTDRRLDWLDAVLDQINVRDPDIADVAPKIMDVLGQRLQGAYMAISEADPGDAVLRKISALNRRVAEVKRMTG